MPCAAELPDCETVPHMDEACPSYENKCVMSHIETRPFHWARADHASSICGTVSHVGHVYEACSGGEESMRPVPTLDVFMRQGHIDEAYSYLGQVQEVRTYG